MTKADLIEEVSRVVEMTRKESEVIVEAIFDSIVRSLRTGDKIEIRGFGSFRTRQRQPRIGRNPKTGARVEVPAKKIPYFKPSKELKDVVNNSARPPLGRRRPPPEQVPNPSSLVPEQHGLSLDPLAVSVHHHDGGRAAMCILRRRPVGRRSGQRWWCIAPRTISSSSTASLTPAAISWWCPTSTSPRSRSCPTKRWWR